MYPFVIKITYFDEFSDSFKPLNVLIYAESFAAAVKYIEDKYIDDIVNIEIHCVGDSIQLFEVSNFIADLIIEDKAINYNPDNKEESE